MRMRIFYLALLAIFVFPQISLGQKYFAPFKFAVIADPHMSVASKDSPSNGTKMFKKSVELLESTIAEINKQDDVDFTVVLGDLTKDAEPWNVDRFKDVMDGLDAPYYVVLGNHDISPIDTNMKNRDPGVTRSTMIWTFQGHGFSGPGAHWSLDPVPNVHLIGLDSTFTGDWAGKLCKKGIEFLKNDLSKNSDKLTIVILHHQLKPYTEAETTGENDFHKFVLYNADEVRSILADNDQVVMTLSGHRHLSTRFIIENDVAYFTMPSTMTWPMRYAIFDVTPEEISYNTYDVPCSPELWEEAKQNALATKTTSWPRTSATPDTPEGNKLLEEIMLSENTKAGRITLQSDLVSTVSQ